MSSPCRYALCALCVTPVVLRDRDVVDAKASRSLKMVVMATSLATCFSLMQCKHIRQALYTVQANYPDMATSLSTCISLKQCMHIRWAPVHCIGYLSRNGYKIISYMYHSNAMQACYVGLYILYRLIIPKRLQNHQLHVLLKCNASLLCRPVGLYCIA